MEVRRDPPPVDGNPPLPETLRVWRGFPKEENWLNLQPIFGLDGELIYHPTLDVDQYNAEQKAQRYWRRRKMWGRVCWGWFVCVLLWILTHNKQFTPDIREQEIRNLQWLMGIAILPAWVRGLWHRLSQGE